MALVLLALVGYGVAAYSLIFPFRTWDEETTVDILYRPYFQVRYIIVYSTDSGFRCTENYFWKKFRLRLAAEKTLLAATLTM